jgi:membrane fusion protein (multidrug efflux system)
VGIRACIDNRQLQLRPGMFARVNTVFGIRNNARVIPEEAIVPQGGRQFVIKLLNGPDAQTKTTQRVEVKVGLRSPGKVEILEGLEPGDTVVTTGQQRVQRDGTVVTVVDLASTRSARPAVERPVAGVSDAADPAVLAGPNPCGAVISETSSAKMPARHRAIQPD